MIGPSGRIGHPAGGSLEIELTGNLTIEAGGVIDVSGLGYGRGASYPGATLPGGSGGGGHLGLGGTGAGTTFGSV